MARKNEEIPVDNNKIVEVKGRTKNLGFEAMSNKKGTWVSEPGEPGYWEYSRKFLYAKKCIYCGDQFKAKRRDTAFCGQACQKAYKRLKASLGQQGKP